MVASRHLNPDGRWRILKPLEPADPHPTWQGAPDETALALYLFEITPALSVAPETDGWRVELSTPYGYAPRKATVKLDRGYRVLTVAFQTQ